MTGADLHSPGKTCVWSDDCDTVTVGLGWNKISSISLHPLFVQLMNRLNVEINMFYSQLHVGVQRTGLIKDTVDIL